MSLQDIINELEKSAAPSMGTMAKLSLPAITSIYGMDGAQFQSRRIGRPYAKRKDRREAALKGAGVGAGGVLTYETLKRGVPYFTDKYIGSLAKKNKEILDEYQKLNPRTPGVSKGTFGRDRYVSGVVTKPDGSIDFEASTKRTGPKKKETGMFANMPKKKEPGVVTNPAGMNLKEFNKKLQPLLDKMTSNQRKSVEAILRAGRFSANRSLVGAGIGVGSLFTALAAGRGSVKDAKEILKENKRLNPTRSEISKAYDMYEKKTGMNRYSMRMKDMNAYVKQIRKEK